MGHTIFHQLAVIITTGTTEVSMGRIPMCLSLSSPDSLVVDGADETKFASSHRVTI